MKGNDRPPTPFWWGSFRRVAALPIVLLAVGGFSAGIVLLLVRGPKRPINHDELNFLFEAMRLPSQRRLGTFSHGPLVYELLAIVEVAWYVIARAVGVVKTPLEHLTAVLENTHPHLIAGRALAGLAAALCIVQLFRLGRIFGASDTGDDERVTEPGILRDHVGALAALTCAANFTFFVFASNIKDDVFFWLFTLTASVSAWNARSGRAAFVAGVALAAAIASKYLAVFWLTLLFLPLLRVGSKPQSERIRLCAWMIAGLGIALLLLFPFLITQPRDIIAAVRGMDQRTKGVGGSLLLPQYLGIHLPDLVGIVVEGAAFLELAIRIRKQPRGSILLAAPACLLLLFMGLRHGHGMGYYIYPVALVLMVLWASFLVRVAGWIASKFHDPGSSKHGLLSRAISTGAVAVMVVAHSSYVRGELKYAALLLAPDTQTLAATSFGAIVPPGSCIFTTGGVAGMNFFGPDFAPEDRDQPEKVGAGIFAQAERAANLKRQGPRYRIRVIDGFSVLARDVAPDCDWLVTMRFGKISEPEFGDDPSGFGGGNIKLGAAFRPVSEVRAFPEGHASVYPIPSSYDYAEFARTSFRDVNRFGARGTTLTLLRRN